MKNEVQYIMTWKDVIEKRIKMKRRKEKGGKKRKKEEEIKNRPPSPVMLKST